MNVLEIMAKYRQYQVYNTGELSDVGKILLDTYPEARVFAFFGEMGAGKTVFIKKICSLLGVTDLVSSPSFPIVNHYISESGQSVYHFDFYRGVGDPFGEQVLEEFALTALTPSPSPNLVEGRRGEISTLLPI